MLALMDLTARRAAFRALHDSGSFVIPNPWDRGSAVLLAQLGFRALATSSAGFAFTRALPDSPDALSRDEVLAHVKDLAEATALPVNVDFQNGYAKDASGVAENIRMCVDAGACGVSIEDATGVSEAPLYDHGVAVERVAAARRAIDASRTGVLLTARAECFLVGHERPLEESLLRLRAFADAGADVLFAPGVREPSAIRAIVDAVHPKPVNVLVGWKSSITVAELAALGVRRVSVGSALARVAWTAFASAAGAIAERGEFSCFDGILSTAELTRRFENRPTFRVDDLTGAPTRALVLRHLAGMHEHSPAESVHALDVDALRAPDVTFWSAWIDGELAGCGALKRIDDARGEIKSMRVADAFLGRGVGRATLEHIITEARARGMKSLWLETGSAAAFTPALRLYESAGFARCAPFDGYVHDPFSIFMTRAL